MTAARFVTDLLASRDAEAAYGEEVTVAEHMLQTAALAESAGADPSTVLAALLHDVGHLVDRPERDAVGNRDHAAIGAELLAPWFGPAVTEPVRLHVAAKRYLVTTEPEYASQLSAASVHTLGLQGGPLDAAEMQRFEAERFADQALAVRRWDDAAKVSGRQVPDLGHYRALIERLATSRPQ